MTTTDDFARIAEPVADRRANAAGGAAPAGVAATVAYFAGALLQSVT